MRLLFVSAVILAALGLYICAAQQLPCDPTCNQGVCEADHGNLSCSCYGNWTGSDCSTFICDIKQVCENGGTCAQHPTNVSQYICACPLGFTGLSCQYKTAGDACDANPCGANGTCYNLASGGFDCLCQEGIVGPQCQFADPNRRCDNLECYDRGVCKIQVDRNGTDFRAVCECDEGFESNFACEVPRNGSYFCVRDPCENGGTCDYVFTNLTAVGYRCTCPPLFTGENCSTPFDVCSANEPCMNGGTCQQIEEGNYYTCQCPPNFTGYNCEYIDNPCEHCVHQNSCTVNDLISRAPNGFYHSDTINLQVDVECECPCGLTGRNCETTIQDFCDPDPCENGGECVPEVDGYRCNCPENYGGHNCSFVKRCASVPCNPEHTERCVNDFEGDDFACICKPGWGGKLCSTDLNECLESPCNGEPCENVPGTYQCVCSSNKTGRNCENFIANCSQLSCTNGGECVDSGAGFVYCNCSAGFTGALCETELCLYDCAGLAGNGFCDSQCYSEGCHYDGGDCSIRPPGEDVWAQCPECRDKFNNGQCDVECNRAECYYDGQDCEPSCQHVEECMELMEDGECSPQCITQQCPFDIVDCQGKPRLATNRLVLILLAPVNRPFQSPWSDDFLEDLGKLTNSIAVLLSSRTLTLDELSERCPPHLKPCNNQTIGKRIIYKVVIELDIQYCTSHCPTDAQDAVDWIQANYAAGRNNIGPYGVADTFTEPSPDSSSSSFEWYYGLTIGLIAIIVLGAGVGILIGKRKRVTAKIWRPTSPSSESDRSNSSPRNETKRKTTGGAVTGTAGSTAALQQSQVDSDEYIGNGAKKSKMEGKNHIKWSDVRVAENPLGAPTQQTDTVVVGQVGKDTRRWNIAHYEATRDPRRVRQLLADYRRQNGLSVDVNAPGPGGYTPLMLVVMKQHHGSHESLVPLKSRSSSESSSDHNEFAALIGIPTRHNGYYGMRPSSIVSHNGMYPFIPVDSSVSALLDAKVDLDAVNDYGQTALHLAAACSRGDYVEQLLDAGANPNLQDNWGQSPLQAAIGAAAEGAFMVLLDHPRLDLTQKSDGGITHLMAAVKIVNQFMVKQLLKKNVDIAATDNDGRTAVHWAAMVDNLEALKLLIRHGPDTIKDAQDNKGQTALFLACREGSASCVKHLLDCFANATLLDNLDRSPMDIAAKKMHTDIMEMLRSTSHGFYHPGHSRTSMVSYMQDPAAMHPMYHPLTRPAKSKNHTRQTSRERLPQDPVSVYSQGDMHRELANAYDFNTQATTSQHNETFADLLKTPRMPLDPSGAYTTGGMQPQSSSMLPSTSAEVQYHTTQQSSPLSHNVDIAASHPSYLTSADVQYPSSSGYVVTSHQVLPVTSVPVTTSHPPVSNGYTDLLPVSTSNMPPLTSVGVATHDQVYDGYSQHQQPTTDQSTQYSLYTQGYTFDAHATDVTAGSMRRLQHLPLATEASIQQQQQQQYTSVVSDQVPPYPPPNQMCSPPQPASNISGSPNSSGYRSPPNSAHSYPHSSPHSLTPSPPDPMSQETHVNAHGTITVQPDYGGIPQHQLSKLFVANHNQLESSV